MLASRHFIGANENRPSNSMARPSEYVSLLQVRIGLLRNSTLGRSFVRVATSTSQPEEHSSESHGEIQNLAG